MIENADLPELPKGWAWVKVQDVVSHEKGKKPDKINSEKQGEFIIPYLNIEALETGKDNQYVKSEGNVLCDSNDILMVWDGSRSGLPFKGRTGVVCSTIRKFRFIGAPEYLYYFLKSKYNFLNTRPKGTGTPHVNPDLLFPMSLPLPPLSEQKRIVTKIEELFTKLDISVENLKSVKKKLDVYRKSVLKKCYKKRDNWLKNTVGKSTLKIEQVIPQNSEFEKFTYIDIASIDNTKQKIVNQNIINSSDAPSRARQLTLVGDIVFSTVRTYLKNIAIIPKIEGIIISSTGFVVLRPNEFINRDFLFYYLLTDKLMRDINQKQVGTSYPAIRKKDLLDYEICFPKNIEEQEQIVNQIESHFSVIDKLEETVNNALTKQEQLRKSILKNAFEGKLISQDPTDEPAEVMLKRIKNKSEEYEQMRLT